MRGIGSIVAIVGVAMWNLLAGFGGCCPPGGSSTEDLTHYMFFVGYGERSAPWHLSLIWGEQIDRIGAAGPLRHVWVVLPEGRRPRASMIELVRDGDRVDLPEPEIRDVPRPPAGCGRFRGQAFDLAGLAPGNYTVVHRRASAPEGLSVDGFRTGWITLGGEERLEAFLVVPVTADAGVEPDAP